MTEFITGSELERLSASPRHRLGALCIHGHDHTGDGRTFRVRSNGTCYSCERIRIDRWIRSPAGRASRAKSRRGRAEKIREASKSYRRRNLERLIAYGREYRARRPEWASAYWGAANAKRRAARRRAVPAWFEDAPVRAIYRAAAAVSESTGVDHEVDHVVPLISALVCGLHVADNLRVIPASANRRKGNRFWPNMPSGVT